MVGIPHDVVIELYRMRCGLPNQGGKSRITAEGEALFRRGRGYRDMNYLQLKAQPPARRNSLFFRNRVGCTVIQILVQNRKNKVVLREAVRLILYAA